MTNVYASRYFTCPPQSFSNSAAPRSLAPPPPMLQRPPLLRQLKALLHFLHGPMHVDIISPNYRFTLFFWRLHLLGPFPISPVAVVLRQMTLEVLPPRVVHVLCCCLRASGWRMYDKQQQWRTEPALHAATDPNAPHATPAISELESAICLKLNYIISILSVSSRAKV